MKKEKILIWSLAVLSGLLLSLPYLVPHCGFVALFAFIPLLCADRIATLSGFRRLWLPVCTAFIVWNTATTFWVCNATVGGGITAIVLNSLQMLAVWGLYRLSRRSFNGSLPYIFFAAAWIAWEKAYFAVDISWPWLTLGNAFARSVYMVQWYDTLGSLGGSLWVWASNLLIFGLLTALSDGRWAGFGPRGFNRKARLAYMLGLALTIFGPIAWALVKWYTPDEVPQQKLDVLVAQPNIDPYHKFVQMSRREQDELLESQLIPALDEYKEQMFSDSLWRGRESVPGMLILAPETFTSYVFTNSPEESSTLNRF